jgi:hypothetical protein
VDKEVVDATFRYGGSIGSFTTNWTVDGRWTLGEMLSCMDLIAPWGEPVEQKPNPTRTRDVEAERVQADLARFLQLTPPLDRAPTPYHRTEQFRAETARMLFAAVVNRYGIWEPCIPDVIQQTDALIAALDKPQPTTP